MEVSRVLLLVFKNELTMDGYTVNAILIPGV